jgi:hypothetical protein
LLEAEVFNAQMRHPMADLEDEGTKLTALLQGKTVKVVRRHRLGEVMIEFSDGTRLHVNNISDGFEFSVTG